MTVLTVQYRAVSGSGLRDGDAEIIGPEIESLGHNATSHAIVQKARPKRSPLHPYFEWDDSVAAESYRRFQAEHLARSITIITTVQSGEEVEVRAFHAVHIKRTNGGPPNLKSYVSFANVAEDPALAEQVLEGAQRELRAWANKYRLYSDALGGVVREVLEQFS